MKNLNGVPYLYIAYNNTIIGAKILVQAKMISVWFFTRGGTNPSLSITANNSKYFLYVYAIIDHSFYLHKSVMARSFFVNLC